MNPVPPGHEAWSTNPVPPGHGAWGTNHVPPSHEATGKQNVGTVLSNVTFKQCPSSLT